MLETVTYYLWLSKTAPAFLFTLELFFKNGESLLLSSGQDSEAISLVSEASLMETARNLQEIHGEPLLQRMKADAQAIWQGAVGNILEAIQLSRHENGLYRNDALLLDFGPKKILLRLSVKDGLELMDY